MDFTVQSLHFTTKYIVNFQLLAKRKSHTQKKKKQLYILQYKCQKI